MASLAEDLVSFFDKHGTPNERMRAHYILGRTYFDLGELPRALETYFDAADCADTTASDCDYKTLSRVHAQSAEVYSAQIQPRSMQLELRNAERYAKKANDSLMVIECKSQLGDVYKYLHKPDSVILIKESVASLFLAKGNERRYAQTLGAIISHLVEKREMTKAKQYIDIYESSSGFFDNDGLIRKGREVYYYVKGGYYLALNDLDSAEICFRTELAYGKDINNQIGGYKGLMEVYTLRNISDSIAKYAAMSYSLNDSAYSLSEMQNVQKLRASYNYHHKQLLAEQEKRKTYKAYLVLGIFVLIAFLSVILALLLFFDFKRRKDAKIYQYRHSLEQLEKAQTELMLLRSAESLEAKELVDRKVKEMEELQSKLSKYLIEGQQAKVEEILDNSNIALHLRELLSKNPPIIASQSDFRELRMFMNETIPCFYSTFNNSNCTLRPIEYDVCLLIRFHFQPAEISKLTGRNDSYISNIRKTILQKAFGIVGAPKDLDKRILQIL